MGQEVSQESFTRPERERYRQKVRRCLDVFAMMLNDFTFDSDYPMTGLEIELNLVDPEHRPTMCNDKVLADLRDPYFQLELGRFNLELNVPPRLIAGDGLAQYEAQIGASLRDAGTHAHSHDASVLTIGILPTLTTEHTVANNLSTSGRYRVLNEEILAARGEQIGLDIRGVERLKVHTDSIAPEAACTSLQFHLQVSPADFAAYWNASQVISALQVAVGANSPFLFGHQLWDETRIALFEQATDTRPDELKAQGVRPRVWFGERWVTSIFDLFEENVRYFPPLLPIMDDEDPLEVVREGGVPKLAELRLHNGTIYRWNRPVYDIMAGRPHLRVENRVLPAGPTVVDMLANAAFYYGLVRSFAEDDRPLWTQLPFSVAQDNFHAAARRGIAAPAWWPRRGEIRITDLVLELLPRAAAGLDQYGVDPAERDRLLGIIEQRCLLGRNGATWQIQTVRALQGEGLNRPEALRRMVGRYAELQQSNEPVHTWPI
ncbi:glutamate--cysteine ligase [Catellatospora tritici]|uniref:glutamate--cysteine ligase n=1 Tax=Catellatospora tritici TaxID=2851566 RepID=UPI001C2D0E9A|nr:glutamate--cysteine ligase [Catellatospora tritici]MBV1853266.1 glutamate--cysteine ligase [Catellatospora tritici]